MSLKLTVGLSTKLWHLFTWLV